MNESNPSLAKLQNINLEMIKLFIRICNKYDLQYFALGGTLLGAVRHQGFIPWDDDVDLGMPRADYERFREIAKRELPVPYRLRTIDTMDDYRTYFCKIEDMDTKLLREYYVKDGIEMKQVYAWIDIMPIDGMPTDAKVFREHHEKLLKGRKLISFSLMDKCMGTGKQRSKKEMLIIKAGLKTGFYKTVNTKKAFEKFDALCQKYPYETSSIVGNTYGVYKTKEFVAKKVFGKGCMLPFEDIEICCPQDYHYYLCHIYGDYQKLPPEEERKGHEIKFA